MRIPCSGVLLSGGENRRFDGKNKSFAKIGSLRIIDRLFSLLKRTFEDIIIVTNNPVPYSSFNCLIVTDLYPIRSSLNGIYSGLFAAPTHFSFFIACDMPFASHKLISFIVDQIETDKDVIIPKTSLGFEPLFAIYSKNCLKPIQNQIEKGELEVKKVFSKIRIKTLNENKIKKTDPNFISFFNINKSDDLAKARRFTDISLQ